MTMPNPTPPWCRESVRLSTAAPMNRTQPSAVSPMAGYSRHGVRGLLPKSNRTRLERVFNCLPVFALYPHSMQTTASGSISESQ